MLLPSPAAQATLLPTTAPAAAEPLDLIFIDGFVGHTIIGIYSSELHATQPLVIDLCAGLPRAKACDTDQIGDTIDYGEVRMRLQRLMIEHGVKLLEALAEQIAHILLHEFGAHWVRVKVAKPRKFDDVQAMGVMIERSRQTTPSVTSSPADTAAHRAERGAAALRLIASGMVPGDR